MNKQQQAINLCACGCGKEVKTKNAKFFNGHHNKSKEVKDKKQKTWLNHFGVSNPMISDSIKRKQKNTIIDKYKVENASQSDEIKLKKKETSFKNYGVSCFFKTNQSILNSRINRIKSVEQQRNKNEPLLPRIGNQERICIDELQKYTEFTIIRNDPSFRYLIGRFPDGHIKECKLFIQFDEFRHFKDKECTIYQDDDILCTSELKSIPGYTVFRICEKRWKENQQSVIDEFKILLTTTT